MTPVLFVSSLLEKIKACSPLGFCVDYDVTIPDDFDGNFEWSPRAGEVTLDPNSKLINEKSSGNLCIRSNQVPTEGIVHQINDNGGELFELGKIPGNFNQRYVVKELLQNVSIRLQNVDKYAFLSSRHTGAISLSINRIANEYEIDPFNPYHKAAYLSWAFLIRKSVCDKLDIETNEFDIGYRISPHTKQPEIYIVEKADNCAGYCNYLNGMEDVQIARDVFIVSLLPAGRVYEEVLMKDAHEKKCAPSCYDCLRDYYNQHHHGLLNWRVALDLAAIANDSNILLNFKQAHWTEYINNTLLQTLENKLNGKRRIIGDDYFIETPALTYLLSHPFWSETTVATKRNMLNKEVKKLNIMDAIAKSKF